MYTSDLNVDSCPLEVRLLSDEFYPIYGCPRKIPQLDISLSTEEVVPIQNKKEPFSNFFLIYSIYYQEENTLLKCVCLPLVMRTRSLIHFKHNEVFG